MTILNIKSLDPGTYNKKIWVYDCYIWSTVYARDPETSDIFSMAPFVALLVKILEGQWISVGYKQVAWISFSEIVWSLLITME